MAKSNNKHQLIRSDQRLLGLGLFSVVLLLGVFTFANPQMLNKVPNQTVQAERVIKVEEFPADLSQVQDADSSYAQMATSSGSMQHNRVRPGY